MNLLSILAQQGPAETNNFFIAGYAVFFTVSALYLVSYFIRFHNLKKDIALLEELDDE
jgi:hypothetical protein